MRRKAIAAVGRATGLRRRKFNDRVYRCEYAYLPKKEAEDIAAKLRKEKGWLARTIKTVLYKWCVYVNRSKI